VGGDSQAGGSVAGLVKVIRGNAWEELAKGAKSPPAPRKAKKSTKPPPDYFPMVRGLCRLSGLPDPTPEYRFHPTRKWRFDFAWIDVRVALEVDGGIWTQGRHSRGTGMLGDHEKLNEAACLGWRVLRTTPSGLKAIVPVLLRALSA
jgi:hypothetical protein